MPKVAYYFRLPEEQDEYDTFRLGPSYALALAEFAAWLRQQQKHGDYPPSRRDMLNTVAEEFYKACAERGFDPLTGEGL
jgi:hypothetical protein